jgi:hypothetical protein
MSKLQYSNTFMPGALFALIGIIEWGALLYFLYLYHTSSFFAKDTPFFVGLASIVYLEFLNLFSLGMQNYLMCTDTPFVSWFQESTPHKIATVSVNIVSTLITHKFRNILFCKLFNF